MDKALMVPKESLLLINAGHPAAKVKENLMNEINHLKKRLQKTVSSLCQVRFVHNSAVGDAWSVQQAVFNIMRCNMELM
ncbi:hypothetical protein [Massilia sp. PWRC2]|uniref:hypothetical protein n=1 Tax=Massilia sp. PWRC2 TaxID=2804626 RepID=UPI003CE6AC3A